MTGEKVLEARHISVSADRQTILSDCSLEVGKGEFIGIIGPNGAGKSTFLKAMRGMAEQCSGDIFLFGKPLRRMAEKETARRLAFMQQDTHLGFGFTCREIVMSARYPYLSWWQREGEQDRAVAEKCMAFTGVLELAEKSVQDISGGERQRVLLAKILAQETPLIFLDEPTASLDLVYQEEIFRCCTLLARQGKTIVMVCHDLTMAARYCSRLVMIAGGRILADGRPAEVMTEEHLREGFGLHSVVYRNRMSGDLDLYTYDGKKKKTGGTVLVLGHSPEACDFFRLLYTEGYRVLSGPLPADSLAAEIASNFRIPPLRREELSEIVRSGQLQAVIGCGMTEEEEQWAGDVPSGIPVYADGPFPGAGTAEEAEECIKKGIWNNRDQKKKE
jgi:iron complex transport system ATP-binding protein